jgi:two-component system phosphate regulon sensor histidine kinase PhoR
MRKLIYSNFIWIALPCVALLSAVMISLIYFASKSGEPAEYIVVASISVVVVISVILVAASYTSHRVAESIAASLGSITLEEDTTPPYDELISYAGKVERQKQKLKERIKELTSRTDTIETITGNMQEALLLIDNYGTILSANNSAHKIFGENIEQKDVKHIYRDKAFQKAVVQCINGNNVEKQLEHDSKMYNISFSPIYSYGDIKGAVILFYDSTEKLKAERQRREFSANVSHELKTPLTTISALAEMIAQGMAKEDDIKSFADRITEQSGRLLVLIDDIIRLSEFDEGQEQRDATNFDLWQLAETVINSLRDSAGSVNIVLKGEVFNISANSRMIDELLYNLVDNGIKYNKDNGTVTVELARIENGACKISVSDTGIGIGEEHHSRVFERFYRTEKSRSKKTGGTGLGLSIVKHITEHYDGTVELDSTEGVGTTITCILVV